MGDVEDAGVHVTHVNVEAGLAICDELGVGEVVQMLDLAGEDTDATSEAVVVVVQWQAGGFTPVDLRDYKDTEVN